MQDLLAGVLIGIAAGAVVLAIFCVSSRMLQHRDPRAASSAAFVATDFPAPQRFPWGERAEFYGHQTFTY